MIARLRLTTQLMRAGLYDTQAAAGMALVVAGAVVEVAHKLTERPDILEHLPPWLQSAVQALLALAPAAELLVIVGGVMAAQGKKLIPATPITGTPSVLDKESDGDNAREFVPWD